MSEGDNVSPRPDLSKLAFFRHVLGRLLLTWRSIWFFAKFGFLPPPPGTDLVGYEILLEFIEREKVLSVDGDLVEIGAFLGGGSYKLAKYLETKRINKKLYVIDIFDPSVDKTECTSGVQMAAMYEELIRRIGGGQSQFEIFDRITRGCRNLVVLKGDSRTINIPTNRLCFGFIDGNHDPAYVENDFYLVWCRLTKGGVVAFDDYNYDLPQVTNTIDKLIDRHKDSIGGMWTVGKVIFIKKC